MTGIIYGSTLGNTQNAATAIAENPELTDSRISAWVSALV